MTETNQKPSPEAAAAAEDARIREHGAALARQAASAIGQPMKPPLSLEAINDIARKAGLPTITVAIPHKIMMTLDYRSREGQQPGVFDAYWGSRLLIPEGVQELPRILLDHWWLRANQVKPYQAPRQPDTLTRQEAEAMAQRAVATALAKRDAAEGKPAAAAAAKKA
jgi:hypothetical protein